MAVGRNRDVTFKVGLFLTSCLVLFVAMLFVYGKTNRAWKAQREIHVVFNNIGNLRSEAVVRYNGLDVGRITRVQLIQLNPDVLAKFPTLTASHLDQLPLLKEDRNGLRGVESNKLDGEIRKKLLGRTMVALTLNVVEKGKQQWFREDDLIRIGGTIMGESAVDIISGQRAVLPPDHDKFLIGESGDMYSNLAKSMDQVRNILGSLSEVVGGGDADSPMASRLVSFDSMTQRLEGMAESMDQRIGKAWDEMEVNLDTAKERMDKAEKGISGVKPELFKALEETETSIKKLSGDVNKTTQAGHRQVEELKARILRELASLKSVVVKQKSRVPILVSQTFEWSEKMRAQVDTIDRVMIRSDRLLTQGFENTRQTLQGLRATFDGLEQKLWFLAKYPWLGFKMPGGAVGYVYFNEWRIAMVTRHYRELRGEVEKARKQFKAQDASDQARIDRINQIVRMMDDYLLTNEVENKKGRRRRRR